MAVNLGNLALLLDIASPRSTILERKLRPAGIDVVLSMPPKREPQSSSCSYASEGELLRNNRVVVVRGKSNSEKNGVGFDAESSDEEGGGFWDSEDWQKEMRRRVREFEDRRELEKKAEELQSRGDDAEGEEEEGKEETEEEKRMRVRKELEKVYFSCFMLLISCYICMLSLLDYAKV